MVPPAHRPDIHRVSTNFACWQPAPAPARSPPAPRPLPRPQPALAPALAPPSPPAMAADPQQAVEQWVQSLTPPPPPTPVLELTPAQSGGPYLRAKTEAVQLVASFAAYSADPVATNTAATLIANAADGNIRCGDCGYSSKSIWNLRRHGGDVHPDTYHNWVPYMCECCGTRFMNLDGIRRHVDHIPACEDFYRRARIETVLWYPCICGAVFPTEQLRDDHIMSDVNCFLAHFGLPDLLQGD